MAAGGLTKNKHRSGASGRIPNQEVNHPEGANGEQGRQMAGKHCLRLPDITVWEMDITADIIAFIVHPTTTPPSPTRAIPSLRLLQKADETLAG